MYLIPAHSQTRTLTANMVDRTLDIAKRKLAPKVTTWRFEQQDAIADIKRCVLAEAISLTDGEALLLSDHLQHLLTVKDGTATTPARAFTPEEQDAYTTLLEALRRAALPFMVSTLIGKVGRFESPSAALSAMWREAGNAVCRWTPRVSPTRFGWFIATTFKTALFRIAADDEGYRHRKEVIARFVALLKGFEAADELMVQDEPDAEETPEASRFSQYTSLDATLVLDRIMADYDDLYIEGEFDSENNPVPNRLSGFWKQPFTTVKRVQDVINDMQMLMTPLSLDYKVDEDRGTLGETISSEGNDEEQARAKEFVRTLEDLEMCGIDLALLDRFSAKLNDFFFAMLEEEDKPEDERSKNAVILRTRYLKGMTRSQQETIEEVMYPFFKEFCDL